MSEINSPYAPGTPCWIDLMAEDQAAAMGFYGDLFGWEGEPGPAEFGGYAVMTLNNRAVAGIGPKMSPDMPHVWTTYLATDDAAASSAAVLAAGGSIMAPPMDVGTLGTMGIAIDPTGAVFGFWGHKEFFGATVVNEPGALNWNECNTSDPSAAAKFYEASFGLTSSPMPGADGYLILHVGDRGIAGIRKITSPPFPEGTPPHWMAWIAVDDTDDTVDRLVRAGGTVMSPPMDMPGVGRLAGVADPWGAPFGVLKGEQQAS
jgi:predicted enzyme related to lactoylglutathione lyase